MYKVPAGPFDPGEWSLSIISMAAIGMPAVCVRSNQKLRWKARTGDLPLPERADTSSC